MPYSHESLRHHDHHYMTRKHRYDSPSYDFNGHNRYHSHSNRNHRSSHYSNSYRYRSRSRSPSYSSHRLRHHSNTRSHYNDSRRYHHSSRSRSRDRSRLPNYENTNKLRNIKNSGIGNSNVIGDHEHHHDKRIRHYHQQAPADHIHLNYDLFNETFQYFKPKRSLDFYLFQMYHFMVNVIDLMVKNETNYNDLMRVIQSKDKKQITKFIRYHHRKTHLNYSRIKKLKKALQIQNVVVFELTKQRYKDKFGKAINMDFVTKDPRTWDHTDIICAAYCDGLKSTVIDGIIQLNVSEKNIKYISQQMMFGVAGNDLDNQGELWAFNVTMAQCMGIQL